MAVVTFKGLGRRKSSTALVKLTPGSGKLVINNRKAEDYFPNKIVIQDMRQPLEVTKQLVFMILMLLLTVVGLLVKLVRSV